VAQDAVYCFCCRHFDFSSADPAFTLTEFNNWKKYFAHENALLKHELSSCHRSSFIAWGEYLRTAESGRSIAVDTLKSAKQDVKNYWKTAAIIRKLS
jgi:hypothetical protein